MRAERTEATAVRASAPAPRVRDGVVPAGRRPGGRIGSHAPPRTGWVVRGLAVLGAVFLTLLVAAMIGFLVLTRPLDSAPGTEPAPTAPSPASTPPTDLAEGEVWVPDADVEGSRIILGQGQDLRDVAVRVVEGRLATDGTIRARHLDVDGVVPFSVVEEEIGRGIRLAPAEDGLVRVRMPVGVFGRGLEVTALARVQADGERIAVTPGRVDGGGIIGGALAQLPPLRMPIPYLPQGMRVTDVRVEADGLRLHAVGDDVVLPK